MIKYIRDKRESTSKVHLSENTQFDHRFQRARESGTREQSIANNLNIGRDILSNTGQQDSCSTKTCLNARNNLSANINLNLNCILAVRVSTEIVPLFF